MRGRSVQGRGLPAHQSACHLCSTTTASSAVSGPPRLNCLRISSGDFPWSRQAVFEQTRSRRGLTSSSCATRVSSWRDPLSWRACAKSASHCDAPYSVRFGLLNGFRISGGGTPSWCRQYSITLPKMPVFADRSTSSPAPRESRTLWMTVDMQATCFGTSKASPSADRNLIMTAASPTSAMVKTKVSVQERRGIFRQKHA
mmetsp:Transcript_52626/g.105640  ORF Transcript_52626/g.105640 Transcript_52626/m.105640 type:complete len:200 (+) Transcript_52626:108-707(+)